MQKEISEQELMHRLSGKRSVKTPATDQLDFGLRHACKESAMYDNMRTHAQNLERLLRAQMAWNCWRPKDDAEREKAKADFDEAARFLSA